MRGTRVTRLLPTLTLTTVAALVLVGCTPPPPPPGAGWIEEFERGRNGVSLEVRLDANEVTDEEGEAEATTEEVYLVPNTTCRVHTYVQDCADADDYLVEPANHVPGLNRRR